MLHGEAIRLLCIRLQSMYKDNKPIYKTFQTTPEQVDVMKSPHGPLIRIAAEGVPGRGRLVMKVLRTNHRAALQMPYDFEDFRQFFYKARTGIDVLCRQDGKGGDG